MDSVSGTASGDTAINVKVVGPAEIRANLFADRLIESDQDRPGCKLQKVNRIGTFTLTFELKQGFVQGHILGRCQGAGIQ